MVSGSRRLIACSYRRKVAVATATDGLFVIIEPFELTGGITPRVQRLAQVQLLAQHAGLAFGALEIQGIAGYPNASGPRLEPHILRRQLGAHFSLGPFTILRHASSSGHC